MVLEISNNKSRALRFFDFSVLSEFSNEDERLFLQGGCRSAYSSLADTGLSFQSIRLMHLITITRCS